jgi:spermidine/putrescine transport system substrate-binding protein
MTERFEDRMRTTRRQFLQRMAAGGSLLAVPGLLGACGGGGERDGDGTGAPAPSTTVGGGASSAPTASGATTSQAPTRELAEPLRISNWTLYIDVDADTNTRPSLVDFTNEFGVRVEYFEDVNSNEEFFDEVQGRLSQGQSIDRDIVILTDYMAARFVELGFTQPLDKAAIPNAANLQPGLQSPTWDPNRDHSLVWQSGMTGIAYDPERLGSEITSVDDLLDPRLKGKITLLSQMPDTLGLIMLSEGLDPTTVTPDMIDTALAKLETMAPHVRQFTGNDYSDLLAEGDVWACFGWSGDVAQLQLDNPNVRFVVPDAGGLLWSDNMLIPTGGDPHTASVFMDYVYRPAVAAKIEAHVNYICPVVGAEEEMEKLDPALASNPLIFPPEDVLARLKSFDPVAANNEDFKHRFAAVAGA